jgi:hypothetical protein
VLCILRGSTISISDIHSSSEPYDLDLHTIVGNWSTRAHDGPKFALMYYNDGIIAVHFEPNTNPNDGRILAIRTTGSIPDTQRLVKEIPIDSSYKLFVRHTSSVIYYGTYTGRGNLGHHEWELRGVSLDPAYQLPTCAVPLQLEDFFGTDIGSTVAFEIHDDHFYALSNQTSFDVEELDWTSFYHCVRFPLNKPTHEAALINRKIYRRQHAEGPIHDSWTDLSIQIDECSNQPVIVESRREWQKGSSRQLRTFYISAIEFDVSSPSDNSPTAGASDWDAPLLPPDDPFTELLDSTNRPNYAPWQQRFSWNVHPEFGPGGTGSARSFILARTKFRAYNYSCSSFIDLVEDERCCADDSGGSANPCLRIRVGSRRPAPLDWVPPDSCGPSNAAGPVNTSPVNEEDSDITYRHSSIKMWPPPASRCPCSRRLHGILSPAAASTMGGNRSVTGVVDESCLVYMVKAGRSYGAEENTLGTVVLVKFNRDLPSSSDRDVHGDTHVRGEFDGPAASQTEWHWAPGQASRCRRGEC